MSTLGKTRRIQWSDVVGSNGGARQIEHGVLRNMRESDRDTCHYVLEVKVGARTERVSMVIRDSAYRSRVVELLQKGGMGRTLQEIKEWPEP